MELRPFGSTGIDVSAVGYGCWEIGGGYGDIEATEFDRAVGRAVGWTISDADMAEIDAIFARHDIDTTPDFWIEES